MNRRMKTAIALAGIGAATAAISIGIFMHTRNNVAITTEYTP